MPKSELTTYNHDCIKAMAIPEKVTLSDSNLRDREQIPARKSLREQIYPELRKAERQAKRNCETLSQNRRDKRWTT